VKLRLDSRHEQEICILSTAFILVLSNWASVSFIRGKVARLEADRSHLSSAWSYTAYVHSAIELCDLIFNYVKVKESRNRPGVAQRFPGGLGSKIFVIFDT
jgi:hypothetical protein